MMLLTKTRLKEIVQGEVANARIEAALDTIANWANESGAQQLKTDVTMLQGTLKTLNREVMLGLVGHSDAATRRANLVYATLNLLDGEEETPKAPTGNEPAPPPSALKILMLTANPAGTTKLNLDKEHAVIAGKLQGEVHRINLFVKRAVNISEFQETIDEERPQVLHFSGHGEGGPSGGIIVHNDEKNGNETIPTEGLDALFEYFKDDGIGLRAVVLNACYSKEQAEVVGKYVEYVIGTTVAIGDDAAIAFSSGFYYKLAETNFDFEKAYKSGRTAATLKGASKANFILYKNGTPITQ